MVVMSYVIKVAGRSYPWCLIDISHVVRKGRIIGNALLVTLEVLYIDRIKTNQRRE